MIKLITTKKLKEYETRIKELEEKIKNYEDTSPEGVVKRAINIAKMTGRNENDEDYQKMMKLLYLSEMGKLSPTMNGYNKTEFIKNNSDEILSRLEEVENRTRMINKTPRIEYKGKKK